MVAGEKARDESCLFCKIIAGEIPCSRVYEDDGILAFLDINPISRGHTLVLPKGHYPTLFEFPASEGTKLLHALKLVAGAVMKECGAGGVNCIQNNFKAAGQMVFHTHWHIIPRFDQDGLPDWPGGKYKDIAEMQHLAASLTARISAEPAGGIHE